MYEDIRFSFSFTRIEIVTHIFKRLTKNHIFKCVSELNILSQNYNFDIGCSLIQTQLVIIYTFRTKFNWISKKKKKKLMSCLDLVFLGLITLCNIEMKFPNPCIYRRLNIILTFRFCLSTRLEIYADSYFKHRYDNIERYDH